MSGQGRAMREGEIVRCLWSHAFKNLLLAENSVMRKHHLIFWCLNATRYYLVTVHLSHVRLNKLWAMKDALSS